VLVTEPTTLRSRLSTPRATALERLVLLTGAICGIALLLIYVIAGGLS
jgi:hypothetical protein